MKAGGLYKKRKIYQGLGISVLFLSVLIALFALFSIIYFIVLKGAGVINLEFLTTSPRDGMTKGGILPAILGTFYLAVGAIIFALPLGVFAAIYLSEYAKQGRLVRIIRLGINNLSGVPSIVFGLFGLAIFVKFFGFGVSILSGALTLGILILPTIIRASEEALLAVPASYREGSFALGATKWQTIKGVVLPPALPGVMTGAILGVGRAAGETAPILFTAATFYCSMLPTSIFDETQALPYHIYALMTEGTHPELHIPIAYGSALVLISLVLLINFLAIIIRYRIRRKNR